jgi:hypothetical protein
MAKHTFLPAAAATGAVASSYTLCCCFFSPTSLWSMPIFFAIYLIAISVAISLAWTLLRWLTRSTRMSCASSFFFFFC